MSDLLSAAPASTGSNTAPRSLRRLSARLGRRRARGVSAVEFALIAPVMLVMLFGAAEASLAVTVDRKVTLASATVADLVAQQETLTCAQLTQIMNVTRTVFTPYGATPASIRVASVAMVGGAAKVEWSRIVDSSGSCVSAPSLPVGTVITIAGNTSAGQSANLVQDLIPTNGAVVMGEVDYAYTSVGTSFFRNSMTMTERAFLRPRKSPKVCFTGVTTTGC
jgi:Flp pilus assembly protein TadG